MEKDLKNEYQIFPVYAKADEKAVKFVLKKVKDFGDWDVYEYPEGFLQDQETEYNKETMKEVVSKIKNSDTYFVFVSEKFDAAFRRGDKFLRKIIANVTHYPTRCQVIFFPGDWNTDNWHESYRNLTKNLLFVAIENLISEDGDVVDEKVLNENFEKDMVKEDSQFQQLIQKVYEKFDDLNLLPKKGKKEKKKSLLSFLPKKQLPGRFPTKKLL
eukprot:maker-scaffold_10-snap-gene-2.6-mRNA-1 protein AED:0.27 eAED:0.27 QI:134/1/1/1/0.5/0.33/3/188/213